MAGADSVVRREAPPSAVAVARPRSRKQQPAWSTGVEPDPAGGYGHDGRDARAALRARWRCRLRGRLVRHAVLVPGAVRGRAGRVRADGVIQFKAKRRVRSFEEQFPEAIDLLARALRAGHAFITGLSMVAEEMPDPVGTEFKLAFDRQNFGMPLPDALRALGERVPLLDARFFVTAVLTQREAGGNLSEVLDNLASVIRERFRVKRQVRVDDRARADDGVGARAAAGGSGLCSDVLVVGAHEPAVDRSDGSEDARCCDRAAGRPGRSSSVSSSTWSTEADMPEQLVFALTAVFVAVAAVDGTWRPGWSFPGRHRNAAACATWSQSPWGSVAAAPSASSDQPDAVAKNVATFVPKSPKEMGRLQRRLTRAGYPGARAAAIYAARRDGAARHFRARRPSGISG